MDQMAEKERMALYVAGEQPKWLEVPSLCYLATDGRGDPNTAQDFQDALALLYPIAYQVRALAKEELGRVYKVGPLEGLWWADGVENFMTLDKSAWRWTLMLSLPPYVTDHMVENACQTVRQKKKLAIDRVRILTLDEGKAAQLLHVGSYDSEVSTIEKLHAFIRDAGNLFDTRIQKHHEIYLSDPRRVVPGKLRTIIRQPVV